SGHLGMCSVGSAWRGRAPQVRRGAVVAPAQAATAEPATRLDRAALREAITTRPGDGIAGVVAEVHRDGQRWRGTAGDLVTGKRISRDAHFQIGSISKAMEAVILLQLSAEGRVDLDQSVQHYLPGLLPEERFKEPISVRQLLNHTSGLPQGFEGAPATCPGAMASWSMSTCRAGCPPA
ncbi:serine hydrolase domain-containing protein, partial [Streptosporangium sp. NPDC003464]